METKSEKIKEALEHLGELEKLLTDRITDLHEVKGGMQSRHAYCYYRKYVWEIQRMLKAFPPK